MRTMAEDNVAIALEAKEGVQHQGLQTSLADKQAVQFCRDERGASQGQGGSYGAAVAGG